MEYSSLLDNVRFERRVDVKVYMENGYENLGEYGD